MDTSSHRSTVRGLAIGVGLLAFALRLMTIRDLTNDHYMHLAWAQQVLFGQVPGRDFVDPGMPLMYMLSAVVQWFSPGPFSEAVLTCTLLAIAASVTLLVTTELTGSIAFGVAATLLEIALEPRLYSYPKILVPAVALLLIQRYVRQPSRLRLLYLAAWTAVAVLLRHDLGLYAAAGIGCALVVAHRADWRRALRALGEYAIALVVMMSPYVLFVQWSEGLVEHLHEAVEFAKGEAHQRFITPPAFPFWSNASGLLSWSRLDAAVFLFYGAHLLAILCLLLLVRSKDTSRRPVAAAGFAMLVMYLVVVLRHPIDSRIRDVAALLGIVGAWMLAETWQRAAIAAHEGWSGRAIASSASLAAAAALAAGAIVNTWILGEVANRLQETRVADGIGTIEHRVRVVKETGTVWPWERFWPAGGMPPAVRYLNACTTRDDAVLITWAAPEYYYFAQRRFGAGHALFLPPDAFTTPHDRERMVQRIRHDRIPIVLINETRRAEFAAAYPEVDRYISDEYVAVGHFDIRDGSRITVAVGRQFKATGTYDEEGWPCGFDSRAARRTASIMLDGSAIPFPAISNAVP